MQVGSDEIGRVIEMDGERVELSGWEVWTDEHWEYMLYEFSVLIIIIYVYVNRL